MSDNIFAELYNRILGLFGQSTPKEDSKDVAVNRLRLVLMQDRTNLTPEILQRMRKELIELLSKYVELDKEALELNFEQEGEQMALMLSIPVLRAKDEAEIEAALKKADEESEEDSEDEGEENDSEPDDQDSEQNENSEEVNSDDEIESEDSDSQNEKNEAPQEGSKAADSEENSVEPEKKTSKTQKKSKE